MSNFPDGRVGVKGLNLGLTLFRRNLKKDHLINYSGII